MLRNHLQSRDRKGAELKRTFSKFLICLAMGVAHGWANDWSSLYESAVLQREKPRLQQVAEGVAANDIRPYLSNGQKLGLAALAIDLPLTVDGPSPIDGNRFRHGIIVLPALTLLFIEDLSQAYAWLWANGFSSETVDEYLSMLRYRKPADFAGGKYPAPLTALHIPSNALEKAAVKKMFLRLRTNAYMFLILRQMAAQRGLGEIDRPLGEINEEQLDLFALELMKRNSETPLGLELLMEAAVCLPDEAHPVTAKRLLEMAHYLDASVIEFVEARPDHALARDAIHAIARNFRASAGSLYDPTAQDTLAQKARQTDISTLSPKKQPK